MTASIDLVAGLGALGFDSFRPGQREAIETLLEKRRALLVAPTGGGKSLTYQLPAILLPGTTLVVSPLIALMHDQVAALEARGVAATMFASTLDGAELSRRARAAARGEFKLIYAAPERLAHRGFRALLDQLECPLVAIDEAHCISEWGHDFRPEYLQLGDLVASMPQACVLACTATATPVVRDEILARLGLGPETPQLVHGFARPNLVLRAVEVTSASMRRKHVDALLAEALGEPFLARGAAIVYAPTRRSTEEEQARLSEIGWRAVRYHAGLDSDERESAQRAFAAGDIDVVVATNAFGMGIDRADVRAVVHLAPPSSIEAYYQEVGRAGRDGEPAWGLLLAASKDLWLRRHLIERGTDDAEVIEHKWGLFLELMRWVEGGSCRHDAILRYFGVEEATEGCGRCDVCTTMATAKTDPEVVTLIARKALSGVARIHNRFGIAAAARLLHGKADERIERAGLDRVSTFGILKERAEEWIVRLLRRCVTAGWVTFSGGDRPLALLTREGREVMQGNRPVRLLLPPRRTRQPAAAGRRSAAPGVHDDYDTDLFEALRAHRLELARNLAVPPYMVASDRSLREMCSLRPKNRAELLFVHGIGPSKAERYGDAFLEIIAARSAPPAPESGA